MTISWSEPASPDGKISHYDHCYVATPIGQAMIEWKSWKDYPGYELTIGNDCIDCFDTLDEAKQSAMEHIKNIASKCNAWISKL